MAAMEPPMHEVYVIYRYPGTGVLQVDGGHAPDSLAIERTIAILQGMGGWDFQLLDVQENGFPKFSLLEPVVLSRPNQPRKDTK